MQALSFRLLLFLACVGSGLIPARAADRPNVLFIIADQWRAQALGFAGDPNVHTPHLDALQKESVWCTHAIAGVPVCGPTRASLLTGQRPLTHGVFMNDTPLNPAAHSLPKALAAAGYDTAAIGKWHVDGHGRSAYIPPERRQGFAYWKVLECTHDYNHSFYYADGPEKLRWTGYDALAQTHDAQDYLRAHAKAEKPFFLYLAWGPPHSPYETAPAEYRARYHAEDMKLRPNVPEAIQKKTRQALAGYYAHCTALDDCVGELMKTLAENGLAENTLVIFTADHGDLLGSHNGFDKQQPYDESNHVPLLLRWPKEFGADNRQVDAVINSEDLMPTLLGLCHVEIPKSVEGLDFSGCLRGGADPSDGATLISCPAPFGQWARRFGGREYRGVRTKRYTYVRDLKGPWLLFDNEADPYQQDNWVNQPTHAEVQAEMEALLTRKLKAAGDEFRPAEEYIKKWGYTVDKTGTVPYMP